MKRHSHKRHQQLSTKETHSSNSIIHISIRSCHTAPSSTINKLNTFSTQLSPRFHRNELIQKGLNNQRATELSKYKCCSVHVINDRSGKSENENICKKNYQNRISPQQDKLSAGTMQTFNTSSDKMGIIIDHHHNLKQKKKKKRKCSPLCMAISLIIGILVSIAIAVLIASFLIKSKTARINLPTGTNYTLRWNQIGATVAGVVGQSGSAANQLNLPFGLAIDWLNTLYISEAYNNRVQRWLRDASTGTTVCGQANGTFGTTSSDLYHPAGIIVDSNSNIYVADAGNSRVQFWASGATSGVTLAGNGTAGNSNNQLNNPYGIALDSSSGTLYIADYANNQVMSYVSGASVGTLAAGTGSSGTNITQISFPDGLYFDLVTNSLIIVNLGTNNVVRWIIGASSWTLIGGSINGSSGSTSTLLNRPVGITVDHMGNVYVADMLNHRIQLFMVGQSSGITIAGVTGVSGSNSTLLYRPYSVALDNQLNLYVSDTYNHRVQCFLRY